MNPLKKPLIFAFASILFIYSCAPAGFVKSKNNSLIHKNSGVLFPEQIDIAKRLRPHRYALNNVSVGYQVVNNDCFVTYTVYVYNRNNNSVDEEFDQAKTAIELFYEEELIDEQQITLDQSGQTIEGKMASYSLISYHEGEPYFQTSYLYLFSFNNWFIKYRITHPNASFVCANEAITNFIQKYKWTRQ